MILYFLIIIIASYLGHVIQKYKVTIDGVNYFTQKKWYKSKCFLAFFLLVLFLSAVIIFRYDVGTDQLSYANFRIPLIINNIDKNIPVGYHWLVRCLHFLISDNLILYNVTTVIEIVIFLYCFFKESGDFSLCVLLFFLFGIFNSSFNISRQMLAVAIVYYGIYQYRRKKYLMATLCLVVAISFHTTAVIFLIIPILDKLHFDGIKSIAILACVFLLKNPLLNLLILISKSFSLLGSYSGYFYGIYFTNGFSINMFFVTFAPLVIFALFNKFVNELNDENVYFSLSLVACIPGILNNLIPNSDRFIFMFIPASCIYASQLSKRLSGRNRVLFNFIVVGIGLAFFCYYILYLNCGETIPYQTWL